jgi:hypothetical protein
MDESTSLRNRRRAEKSGALSFWWCCNVGLFLLAAFGVAAFIIALINAGNLSAEETARIEKDMSLMDSVTQLGAKDMSLMDSIAQLEAKDVTLMDSVAQLEAKDVTLMDSVTQLEAKDMTLMNSITQLEAKDMALMNSITQLEAKDVGGNDTAVYDRMGLPQKNINMAQNPIDWAPVYEPPFITQISPTQFQFNEAGIYTFQTMLPTSIGGTVADPREAMVVNALVCFVPSIGPVTNALNSFTYFGNLNVDHVAVSNENRIIAQGETVEIQLNLQIPNTFNTNTGANPGTNTIGVAIVNSNSCCNTNLIIRKIK